MPLARKLRAAKPQVRRARRYCASECSFHPDCGSAKPEQTHSRTSSRLMCAVGTARRAAQCRATVVLPAPAGPISRTASVAAPVPLSAGCGTGSGTGPPGGSWTCPVESGGGGAGGPAAGRAPAGSAGGRWTGRTAAGPAGGAVRRAGAVRPAGAYGDAGADGARRAEGARGARPAGHRTAPRPVRAVARGAREGRCAVRRAVAGPGAGSRTPTRPCPARPRRAPNHGEAAAAPPLRAASGATPSRTSDADRSATRPTRHRTVPAPAGSVRTSQARSECPVARSGFPAGRCQPSSSSATARSASRYEPMPNPAIVPLATAATTDVWRNSSRVYGLEMCTSISGAVRCAAASRIPYE